MALIWLTGTRYSGILWRTTTRCMFLRVDGNTIYSYKEIFKNDYQN